MRTPVQLSSMTTDQLNRALASARSRRDAYSPGREPREVLAQVAALTAEQLRRRERSFRPARPRTSSVR